MGLTELAGCMLVDTRTGHNGQHGQVGLLRQAVYSRLAGYEDTNDAGYINGSSVMLEGGTLALPPW